MTGTLADALKGGGKYVRWDDLGQGQPIGGRVLDVVMRQARKFESDDLDYWDDGTAKMQAVVTIQTDLRDREDPEDDGARNITVNLWSGQKSALKTACRAAGVAEPKAGDTFEAVWTSGVGKAKDPRVFAYRITPGSGLGSALGSDPFASSQPAVSAPQAAPVSTPAPAASAPQSAPQAAPTSKPEQVKQLHAAGLDAATIAGLVGPPFTPEAVQALINLG